MLAGKSTSRAPGLARLFITRGTNPYVSLLYDELAKLGLGRPRSGRLGLAWLWRARHDVTFLHFSWGPDAHYVWRRLQGRPRRILAWLRLGLFACRLLSARLLRYRIVWTIHEVYSPSSAVSRRLDRAAARLLAFASHVLFTHDDAVADRVRAELGRAVNRIEVVPHGSYIGVYPQGRDRIVVRDALGLSPEAFLFLCFGKVRSDKRIDLLLDAFQALANENAVLIVAGKVADEEVAVRVAEAAASDARIRPVFGLVPNDRVAELFAASDAAVLGRSEIWTSGSMILALSLGVPVVASRLPCHEELLGGERAGWLFEPGDTASLGEALERAMADRGLIHVKRSAALEHAAALPAWSEVAERFASSMLATTGQAGIRGKRSPIRSM